jgi:hypothetical protein
VGHQISVSFEKFDVVQALLSSSIIIIGYEIAGNFQSRIRVCVC